MGSKDKVVRYVLVHTHTHKKGGFILFRFGNEKKGV